AMPLPAEESGAPSPSPALPAEGTPRLSPPATLPISPSPRAASGPEEGLSESEVGGLSLSDLIPPRPRFDVSVRVGPSFEAGSAVPAFAVGAGIGDGPLGFVAELCSTQASGRFHGTFASRAIDRLAF